MSSHLFSVLSLQKLSDSLSPNKPTESANTPETRNVTLSRVTVPVGLKAFRSDCCNMSPALTKG